MTTMTPDERLTEVFDRALRNGVEHLTPAEHPLYLIQDFILEQEMSGLSGYFCNRLPDLTHIQATVDAMRRYGLVELAKLLSEALHLFDGYIEPKSTMTWNEILARYDPSNRLDAIWKAMSKLQNYGLSKSTIR
jgi:hypothetical protein